MSSPKLKEIFEKYIDVIEKLGPKFDFYKLAKPLDLTLERANAGIKSNQFFAKVFEELEDPKSSWKIPYDRLKIFLENLPDEWVKKKLSDDILIRLVPQIDWHKYRNSSWTKQH